MIEVEGGIKVFFTHDYFDDPNDWRRKTQCRIDTPEGGFSGVAICSYEDNFSRSVGRKIALARAILGNRRSGRNFSKVVAKRIWDKYFEACKNGKNGNVPRGTRFNS